MTAASRARLVSIGVLAAVFGSGIVVGLAWDRRMNAAEAEANRVSIESADSSRTSEAGKNGRGDEGRRRGRPMYMQVDPTEAQQVRIDSIVNVYRDDVRSFHRESRRSYDEGMRALVLETREAIMSVLTPAQAAQYDSLTTALDARARDEERGGNRP